MAPKIAIVFYSLYGHVQKLAEAEAEGIKAAGGTVDLYQVPETLSDEILGKMHAPPKDQNIPVLSNPSQLEQYDAFLFGIPTRYGNFPAQWKTFWDSTGQQWQTGAFWGKYAGLFVSTGTLGGGQETTAINAMSTLSHHGFIFVPLGYKTTFSILADLSEVRGGSAWGAGTFSGADGSRQPSAKELELAREQGKAFFQAVNKVNFSGSTSQVKEQGTTTAASTGQNGITAAPAPAAATTTTKSAEPVAPVSQQNGSSSAAPQQKEKEESKGACGLPFKCSVA